MIKNKLQLALFIGLTALAACKKDKKDDTTTGFDKLLLVTNITSANPIVGYVGTLKDLSVGSFTNARSRQFNEYPFITVHKDYVFVIPNKRGDVVKRLHREINGMLIETGSMTLPSNSQSITIVVESDTKAYCSLQNTGKIAVFNPTTMQISSYIDLTSYAIGDGSPDPSVMALRNGKLYVACVQTSDGYTSTKPAQMLIIDVNNNQITSATDNRTSWCGSIDEKYSLMFDESGDLYVFCTASYGFVPGQKSGYLRIKNGQATFDPTYFFNVSDLNIVGIPNGKVDYLQHMHYFGNGIAYSTGNIYALASNPPNYVTDRTMGSFKVDLYNKTITKLDLPYSNGYAASINIFENKILFGLATATGVGIYTYDPATNTTSKNPVVTTQGDPSLIEVF